MIPGYKNLPYEERLRKLDSWTLEERRNPCWSFTGFQNVQRIIYNTLQLSIFFTLITVVNTRGHTAKIARSRCQLDIRRFFFSSRVIDRWTRLQQSFIDSGCVNTQQFQERSRPHKEGNDGLLHGLVGPLSPLAEPVLKTRLQDRCGRTWYVMCWTYPPSAHTSLLCVVHATFINGCINDALLQCCARRVVGTVAICCADRMSYDVVGTEERQWSSNKSVKQKYLLVYHCKTKLSFDLLIFLANINEYLYVVIIIINMKSYTSYRNGCIKKFKKLKKLTRCIAQTGRHYVYLAGTEDVHV